MKTFFANKFAFVAIFLLFAFALTWNLAHGDEALSSSHLLPAPVEALIAHGPSVPPTCDGCVQIAHGPSIPPTCDGCVLIAHGPPVPPTSVGCVLAGHAPPVPPAWYGWKLVCR